jgi:hypothetical protein
LVAWAIAAKSSRWVLSLRPAIPTKRIIVSFTNSGRSSSLYRRKTSAAVSSCPRPSLFANPPNQIFDVPNVLFTLLEVCVMVSRIPLGVPFSSHPPASCSTGASRTAKSTSSSARADGTGNRGQARPCTGRVLWAGCVYRGVQIRAYAHRGWRWCAGPCVPGEVRRPLVACVRSGQSKENSLLAVILGALDVVENTTIGSSEPRRTQKRQGHRPLKTSRILRSELNPPL